MITPTPTRGFGIGASAFEAACANQIKSKLFVWVWVWVCFVLLVCEPSLLRVTVDIFLQTIFEDVARARAQSDG
jgi:hypothetical protein